MTIKQNLKKIYSKEYLILIGIGFLPLLWKILEIAFLANFENALKILAQIALINIIFKVFEESIINPLYKTLSQQGVDKNTYIAKKFLFVYSIATLLFTIILFIFSSQVLKVSQVPAYIFDDTLVFLRVYIVACGFGVISKYLYTCSIISQETKKLAIYLFIKSVITAILFIILVPKFTCGLSVIGVAIAELVINIITIIYLSFSLIRTPKNQCKINLKEYFKLFAFSFVETLIRNIVYYCVILVFLNMIDNQNLYFVSNEYIWSIMLVPTLAQSTMIKQEVSGGNHNLKPYFINLFVLFGFILMLVPMALLIFKYCYNLPNYYDYFLVLIKLLPCYFIFVVDSIIEAYFISTGKMQHVLVQSLLTNILVYLTAFILYLCGVITISLDIIILLFNLGVIVSSIYTICIYIIVAKDKKAKQNQ